jgi:hypothetical protein
MRATVHSIFSTDADFASFIPSDPLNFSLLVRVMAGPSDSDGEESFDVVVCTPGWFLEQVRAEGPLSGSHHLFVDEWSADLVASYLRSSISQMSGETWRDLATKIGKLARWEFEDYVDFAG